MPTFLLLLYGPSTASLPQSTPSFFLQSSVHAPPEQLPCLQPKGLQLLAFGRSMVGRFESSKKVLPAWG